MNIEMLIELVGSHQSVNNKKLNAAKALASFNFQSSRDFLNHLDEHALEFGDIYELSPYNHGRLYGLPKKYIYEEDFI